MISQKILIPFKMIKTHASILICCLVPNLVFAINISKNVQVHGFATQGYIKTDNYNFFGETARTKGDVDFRELGINTSYRAFSNFHVAAQLLSREAGAIDDSTIQLDYALADLQITATKQHNLGLRAGRIKNPIGFYNETRDVAFTRNSIFLPQSIYFDRVRKLALSADGLHIYGQKRHHFGEFDFQFGVGYPRVDRETEIAIFKADRAGTMESNLSLLAHISHSFNAGNQKIALSWVRLSTNYLSTEAENLLSTELTNASFTFTPIILSALSTHGDFTISGEYARRSFKFNNMAPYVPDDMSRLDGESYYVQLQYRPINLFEIFFRYDVIYIDKNDKDGLKFEAKEYGNRIEQFAKDATAGFAIYINRSWLFRAEYHRIEGTAWIPAQDNPGPLSNQKNWQLFSVSASYKF